jgi:endonuclease/exonuclease/phosphatase family metal-dependent hydrolase
MKAATACASELGRDRSDLGTVFGPTNVAIHKVAIAVELGNAGEALANASNVNLDAFPQSLSERRARYLIDVARSHALVRDRSEAINALLKSEKIAPEELRNHRLTHKVLLSLLAHGRKEAELLALADRCALSY